MSKRCPKGTHWNPSRGECDKEGLRRASLGKFEGGIHIDKYVHEMTLDGGVDEEAGDSSVDRWYGIMKRNPKENIIKRAKEHGDTLTKEEKKYLDNVKGIIVTEDNSGFFDATYYEDEKELQRDWKEIESDIERFNE